MVGLRNARVIKFLGWCVQIAVGGAAVCFLIWLALWMIHFFTPPDTLANAPAFVQKIETHLFERQRSYPRGQPLDAIQRWHDQCVLALAVPGSETAKNQKIDEALAGSNLRPEIKALYQNLSNLVFRMDGDQSSSNAFIETYQDNARILQLITICLTMMTTVIAAIKASDISPFKDRWAPWLILLSIVLPASATAVASINPLFIQADATARKSQMNADIVKLASEISRGVAAMDCLTPESYREFVEKINEWNGRYAAILIDSLTPASRDPTKI